MILRDRYQAIDLSGFLFLWKMHQHVKWDQDGPQKETKGSKATRRGPPIDLNISSTKDVPSSLQFEEIENGLFSPFTSDSLSLPPSGVGVGRRAHSGATSDLHPGATPGATSSHGGAISSSADGAAACPRIRLLNSIIMILVVGGFLAALLLTLYSEAIRYAAEEEEGEAEKVAKVAKRVLVVVGREGKQAVNG